MKMNDAVTRVSVFASVLMPLFLLTACGGEDARDVSSHNRYLATDAADATEATEATDGLPQRPPPAEGPIECTDPKNAPTPDPQSVSYLDCGGYYVDVSQFGHTWVVGKSRPIVTHGMLDAVERVFLYRSFPDFPEALLDGATEIEHVETINYRHNHWRELDGLKTRTWEFIASAELLKTLSQTYNVSDPIRMLIKHEEMAAKIYRTAKPSLGLVPYLDRILVVSKAVLNDIPSGDPGWHVRNDMSFSHWANDEFRGENGVVHKHIIPQDVDSRWAMGQGWESMYRIYARDRPDIDCTKFDTANPCAIDFALLHELVHHNPVGDLYVYDPTYSAGIVLPMGGGKKIVFSPFSTHFARNDLMAQSLGDSLSAHQYETLYRWMKFPEQRRTSQHFYPYHASFYTMQDIAATMTISIGNLNEYSITKCSAHRIPYGDPLYAEPTPYMDYLTYRHVPAKMQSLSMANGACTIVLSGQDQFDNSRGLWIMLGKADGALVPIYLPTMLFQVEAYEKAYRLQDLTAAARNAKINLKLLPRIQRLFNKYNAMASSTTEARVPQGRIRLKALFIRPEEFAVHDAGMHYVELATPLDAFGNQYYMGFVEE